MASTVFENLNIVTVGPPSSGKSTLCGHLLVDFGQVDDRTFFRIKNIAKNPPYNNESKKYAFLMDRLEAERAGGCTIEATLEVLRSENRCYTLLDAPGDARYIKHCVSSLAQSDAALLVLSVTQDFESEVEPIKECAVYAYTLGVQKLIVCINKMDAVNYDQEKFESLKANAIDDLKRIGFKPKRTVVIPMSALNGENLITPSQEMQWYNGPTLFEALENFKIPKSFPEKDFRFVVHKVHRIGWDPEVQKRIEEERKDFKRQQQLGQIEDIFDEYIEPPNGEFVVVGRIGFGRIKRGQNVVVQPSNTFLTVKHIEFHRDPIAGEFASAGQIVGISFEEPVTKNEIKRGSVISIPGPAQARPITSFVGQIILLGGPEEFKRNFEPMICAHGIFMPCTVVSLRKKFERAEASKNDNTDGTQEVEKAQKGEGVICELRPRFPCVLEQYASFPSLGRFLLRDQSGPVAVGVCKELVYADEDTFDY